MAHDFLVQFLGDVARAKITRTFVLNAQEQLSISEVSQRSKISTQAVGRELRALSKLKIIVHGKRRVQKSPGSRAKQKWEVVWRFNSDFAHARALSTFVREVSPEQYAVIVKKLRTAGRVSTIILSGAFIHDETRPADIVIAGDSLNQRRLEKAVRSFEPLLGRELRYCVFSNGDLRYRINIQDRLIRDTVDYPHLVLLDKGQVFSS